MVFEAPMFSPQPPCPSTGDTVTHNASIVGQDAERDGATWEAQVISYLTRTRMHARLHGASLGSFRSLS